MIDAWIWKSKFRNTGALWIEMAASAFCQLPTACCWDCCTVPSGSIKSQTPKKSYKSLHTLFYMYLDHMLTKLNKNLYGSDYTKLDFSDKKKWALGTDIILGNNSVTETIVFHAKLWISRLPSFSVPKSS